MKKERDASKKKEERVKKGGVLFCRCCSWTQACNAGENVHAM